MAFGRKRRIFKSSWNTNRGSSRRIVLVLLTGGMIVSGGTWFGLQPSEAPASTSPPGHITAEANQTRVIDGATLILGDRTVQLAGVRIAGRGTMCVTDGGARTDCGAAAANALWRLVQDSRIDCALNGSGQGGRPLATCSVAGREINTAMVAAGWARADTSIPALAEAEQHARAARLGLWADPGRLAD